MPGPYGSAALDDFNRANESPLATGFGWQNQQIGGSTSIIDKLRIVSNAAERGPSGFTNAGQAHGTLFTNCEVFATLATSLVNTASSSWNLMARASNLAASSGGAQTYYEMYLLRGNSENWQDFGLFRTVLGARNQIVTIGTSGIPPLAVGDALALCVYDYQGWPRVEGWVRLSGTWRLLGAFLDTSPALAIYGAGYTGMFVHTGPSVSNMTRFDDFGAGEISVPTYTLRPESFPGFTGAWRDKVAVLGSPRTSPPQRAAFRDRLAEKWWTYYVYLPKPGVIASAAGTLSFTLALSGKAVFPATAPPATGPGPMKGQFRLGARLLGKAVYPGGTITSPVVLAMKAPHKMGLEFSGRFGVPPFPVYAIDTGKAGTMVGLRFKGRYALTAGIVVIALAEKLLWNVGMRFAGTYENPTIYQYVYGPDLNAPVPTNPDADADVDPGDVPDPGDPNTWDEDPAGEAILLSFTDNVHDEPEWTSVGGSGDPDFDG